MAVGMPRQWPGGLGWSRGGLAVEANLSKWTDVIRRWMLKIHFAEMVSRLVKTRCEEVVWEMEVRGEGDQSTKSKMLAHQCGHYSH